MNTFLISLGAALVLVLTAALIGPRFVDWDGYRELVEVEGERLVGRPVTIDGDLEVRVLPTPLVRANSVILADAEGAGPLFEAREIELWLDLPTLISGGLEVTRLVLVEPEIRIDRLAGEFARTIGARPAATSTRPAQLRRLEAVDATLTFADPMSGIVQTVSDVDAQVTATALTGPFKVTGQYGEPGIAVDGADRPAFTASIGSIARAAPVQLAGRVELLGLGSVIFDGEISELARLPRFVGRLKVEHPIAGNGGAAGRLAFEADADIAAGEAELTDLRVAASEGENAMSLVGSGRASWVGEPRFSADLRTRQVDLDATLGSNNSTALAGGLAAAAATLAELVTERGAEGRLQVAVDGLIWRGELARDIVTSVTIAPDAIEIVSLQANLPGETDVKLSGRMDLEEERFAGSIVGETIEAARLARWAFPGAGEEVADVLGRARGKFSVRGDVEASADSITLDEVEGFVDAHAFTGSLGYQGDGERPLFVAEVELDRLDLDRFLPADDSSPLDLFDLTVAPDALGADLKLAARAKRMTIFGREAEGVELAGTLTGGVFDIENLAIGNLIDSGIALSGKIEPTSDGPAGAVRAEVSSRSLPRLIDALRLSQTGLLAWDVGMPLNANVADLVVTVDSDPGGSDQLSSVAVTGDLSGLAVELSVGSDAPLPEFMDGTLDAVASIEARDTRHLFGPDGLYPVLGGELPSGAGRVSLTAAGRIAEGLDATLLVDALGGVAEASGQLGPDMTGGQGRLDIRVEEWERLARALGLAPGDASSDAPVEISASLDARDGVLSVGNIAADLGVSRMTAEATVTPGDPPSIDIRFDAQRASLPWLAASAFGPDRSGDGEASRSSIGPRVAGWPTDLVDVSVLGAARVTASGHVARLALGAGMVVEDAQLGLALKDGVLTVSELAGGLAGGDIAISGTVAGADHALQVDGELAASGVRVADFLTDGRGRALVSGQANLDARFNARGRSLLSLVSSLEGTGKVVLVDAAAQRFDLGAVLGVADIADASTVVEAALVAGRPGETRVFFGPGSIESANGRIKIGPVAIAADGLRGEATSFVDIASRRLDQELVLEGQGTDPIHLALIHAGPFGEIGREVEITNLPALGSARWTEPFDDFGLPPEPAPEPDLPEPVPFSPPAEAEPDSEATLTPGDDAGDGVEDASVEGASSGGEGEAQQGEETAAVEPAAPDVEDAGEPPAAVEAPAVEIDQAPPPAPPAPIAEEAPASIPEVGSESPADEAAAAAPDVPDTSAPAVAPVPPQPVVPPLGLIGQEVIDLPLLQQVAPNETGGGSG